MIRFIQEVWSELQKVTWPTRSEVIRLTAIVIVISAFVGIYLGALDAIFTTLLELVIR